jgi:hypothetical protein
LGITAISAALMVATSLSVPAANAEPSQNVSVRPGSTTRARKTNRSPLAGASRLVLNSTVSTSASAGIRPKAA